MIWRRWLLFFLLGIPLIPALAHDKSQAELTLQACRDSLQKKYEIQLDSSFVDDDRNYREHGSLKFGEYESGAIFVEYGETRFEFSSIRFINIPPNIKEVKSESLAIARADLFERTKGRVKFSCILAPLSGLGSSGSYQKFAALIALKYDGVKINQPVGEIIRRR